jgi:hypothetical protein
MNYQKQFNDIFLELYSTDFVNSESKLNKFIDNNPGILTDFELDRKISLLKAQGFERESKLAQALEVYLEIWDKYYSVETVNYLLIGSTIAQLFLKMHKKDNAVRFAQTVFKEISSHGFENHELILSINLFRMLPAADRTDSKTQQFIDYLKKQLGPAAEDVMEGTKLEDLENSLRNEGQWLTKILATASPASTEATLQDLEEFLASAINPVFRRQASHSYENLKKT